MTQRIGLLGILLLNIVFVHAQDTSRVRMGLGISIVDIKDLTHTVYSSHAYAPNFSLPIVINKKFKVEPSIGYYTRTLQSTPKSENNGNSYKLSDSNLHLGVGIFYIINHARLSIYNGFYFTYIIAKSKNTYRESVRTLDGTGYSLAPTIGTEFFMGNHFSLGGELQFNSLQIKYKDVYTSSSTNNKEEEEKKYTSFFTRTLLFIRFYF